MSSPPYPSPGSPLDVLRTNVNLATSRSERWKKSALVHTLGGTLDRVNILGSDSSGHTGYVPPSISDYLFNAIFSCVNALSWAADGELLLSGGDDTTYVFLGA